MLYHGHILLKILMVKTGTYYEKEMQKKSQSEFRVEKVLK